MDDYYRFKLNAVFKGLVSFVLLVQRMITVALSAVGGWCWKLNNYLNEICDLNTSPVKSNLHRKMSLGVSSGCAHSELTFRPKWLPSPAGSERKRHRDKCTPQDLTDWKYPKRNKYKAFIALAQYK